MAEKGVSFNRQVVTNRDANEVSQYFLQSLQGGGGYFDSTTISAGGPNAIFISRKFVPTWAIVVAVIGFFCFLVGLLALLYRETENATVSIQANPQGGTVVSVNGQLSSEISNRIHAIMSNLEQ